MKDISRTWVMQLLPAVVAGVGLCACVINITHHSEDAAAAVADRFITLLNKGDYETLYSECAGKQFSLNTSAAQLKNLKGLFERKNGKLLSAQWESYMPVYGRELIKIYIRATHQRMNPAWYSFLLSGTKRKGYRVEGLFIGNQITDFGFKIKGKDPILLKCSRINLG